MSVDSEPYRHNGDSSEKNRAAVLAAAVRPVHAPFSAEQRLADLIDRPASTSPTATQCLMGSTDFTASVLERVNPGALQRAARLGLVLEIAVSVSGPVNGVAVAAATLAQAGCSDSVGQANGTWIGLRGLVHGRIDDELVPPPRPAGVSLDVALHVTGAASALPELLGALGASELARRAIAPDLHALAEAEMRRRGRLNGSAPSKRVS